MNLMKGLRCEVNLGVRLWEKWERKMGSSFFVWLQPMGDPFPSSPILPLHCCLFNTHTSHPHLTLVIIECLGCVWSSFVTHGLQSKCICFWGLNWEVVGHSKRLSPCCYGIIWSNSCESHGEFWKGGNSKGIVCCKNEKWLKWSIF